MREKKDSHRENKFSLGKIMSLQPMRIGIKRLPKPPMRTGMMRKNIMSKPWNVMTEL
jgi:hypothetical protein